MTGYDLDTPLRVDDCPRCLAVHWRDCICDPDNPRRVPTDAEVEAAREQRLTRAERDEYCMATLHPERGDA